MNLWYLFLGILLMCMVASPISKATGKLPRFVQNGIGIVLLCVLGVLMLWAIWFQLTGQVDPALFEDPIRR